jgi:hypothetical protein
MLHSVAGIQDGTIEFPTKQYNASDAILIEFVKRWKLPRNLELGKPNEIEAISLIKLLHLQLIYYETCKFVAKQRKLQTQLLCFAYIRKFLPANNFFWPGKLATNRETKRRPQNSCQTFLLLKNRTHYTVYHLIDWQFSQVNKFYIIKGTVSRDFRPLVFFIKQSPLGPWFMG